MKAIIEENLSEAAKDWPRASPSTQKIILNVQLKLQWNGFDWKQIKRYCSHLETHLCGQTEF